MLLLEHCVECEACGASIKQTEAQFFCDSPYCAECFNDRFVCCEDCGEYVANDDSLEGANGNSYCESCWNDTFTTCERCNDTIWQDDAKEGNGSLYCESCWDEQFAECEGCGDTVRFDGCRHTCYTTSDGEHYCESCYYERYDTCEDCGEEYSRDDLTVCGDQTVCRDCATRYGLWQPTGFYNNSRKHVKVGSTRKFGLELETASCEGAEDLSNKRAWGCKHDASINGEEFYSDILHGNSGLEAVDDICEYAHSNGWEVDDRCGLHLHLDMRGESVDSLYAIAAAYRATYDVWSALVEKKRLDNSFCHASEWDFNTLSQYYQRGGSVDYPRLEHFIDFTTRYYRYDWFNLHAYSVHTTFEIRLHQGSLNAEEIRNWVRAHTIFADYASRVGNWQKVRDEFVNLGTSGAYARICELWIQAGQADLVEYYNDKVKKAGTFQPCEEVYV